MKSNVAPMPRPASAFSIQDARVMGIAGETVMVDIGDGVVNALPAFGLLVAPKAGDRVLVSRSEKECYVLNVLERPGGDDMVLEFPGAVRFSAPKGDLDVAAKGALNLMSSGRIRLLGDETQVTSARVSVQSDTILTRARSVETHAEKVSTFAGVVDTVAKRIAQRADHAVRWIEGLETLNIGSLVQTVRRSLVSHSRQAVMTAQKDLRIDAERIHMG